MTEIPQERRVVTAIPGPKSQELQARRVASVAGGVGSVLLSLGASGAIYRAAETDTTLYAPTPRAKVRSTVGAGDVLLATFLFTLTSGGTFADALSSAVGWAAAKVEQPGTTMPTEPLRGA